MNDHGPYENKARDDWMDIADSWKLECERLREELKRAASDHVSAVKRLNTAEASGQRMREALERVRRCKTCSTCVKLADAALAPHPTPRTQEGEGRDPYAGTTFDPPQEPAHLVTHGPDPVYWQHGPESRAAPAAAQGVEALREVETLRKHLHAMVDLADYHVHEIEDIASETRDPADIARAKRVRALFNAADQALAPRAPPEGDAAPALPRCTPLRCRIGLDFHHCKDAGHQGDAAPEGET